MKRRRAASRSKVLLIGTLTALATVTVLAVTRPHANAGEHATAAQAGMRAVIDPETGQLGTSSGLPAPTAEEKALLQPAQAQPRQVVLPDGSVMVELNGTGQEFAVMHIDAAGKRSVQCVQDVGKALQTPPPAVTPEER